MVANAHSNAPRRFEPFTESRHSDGTATASLGPEAAVVDFEEHLRTYRWFVRGVLIFAAHTLLILMLLAFIFL